MQQRIPIVHPQIALARFETPHPSLLLSRGTNRFAYERQRYSSTTRARRNGSTGMDRLQWAHERCVLSWHSITRRTLLEFLDLTHDYKTKANTTTFVADMNVTYVQEVHEGDPLRFTTRILNCDEKEFISGTRCIANEGYLAATNELLSLHIDLTNRRVGPMAPKIAEGVRKICDRHSKLPEPSGVGRLIGMKRPSV